MMSLGFSMDSLPFAAMAVVEIGEVGMITLAKAAMSGGMSNFVYVVYYNALAFRIYRHQIQLPDSCFDYGQPDSRMEKVALKNRSSQAKILGTIVSISGAFIVTLYKGPPLLGFSSPSNSYLHLPVSQYSNWALGGLLLTVTCLSSATWKIFQAAVLKEYSDKMTLVFFTCFFGTIQCAIVSLMAERDPSAWKVHSGTELIAVVYAAIVGTVYRTSVIAWCLHKKGPVFVALFKPFGTVIAVIMAVMLLGETPHLGSLIGATVIAFGFYAVLWGQAKENTTANKNNSLESSNQKLSFSKNT